MKLGRDKNKQYIENGFICLTKKKTFVLWIKLKAKISLTPALCLTLAMRLQGHRFDIINISVKTKSLSSDLFADLSICILAAKKCNFF